MTDIELRDIFKYKKFKLSSDNSEVYFELDQVRKDGHLLGNYYVKVEDNKCIMTFDPPQLVPFLNIWMVLLNGQKLLLNMQLDNLMTGDTITLKEV